MNYVVFFGKLQWCDGVDFFQTMLPTTEGFKLGYSYSDVAQLPVDSPMGIPTERVYW